MATTYSIKTLRELIDELRSLPAGSLVNGLRSGEVHSDRGFYERGALVPDKLGALSAKQLAEELERSIGTPMTGWKGGDYIVSERLPVAYADYGHTGPYIAGFVSDGQRYEPVLVETGWW